MNVELVLVLFVALLYGPTVLWLIVRTLRGHRSGCPRASRLSTPSAPSLPPATERRWTIRMHSGPAQAADR